VPQMPVAASVTVYPAVSGVLHNFPRKKATSVVAFLPVL